MTDNERERIAVLESEVQHLNKAIEKMSRRQDEMYNLMMQTKGGWKTLVLLAALSGVVGGTLVKIGPYLGYLPK